MTNQSVLKVKKIIHMGEPHFEVLGWSSVLKKDQLPIEYTREGPFFYEAETSPGHGNQPFLRLCSMGDIIVGMKIPKDQFGKIIRYLKGCGDRLTKINRKVKEIQPKWNGQEMDISI